MQKLGSEFPYELYTNNKSALILERSVSKRDAEGSGSYSRFLHTKRPQRREFRDRRVPLEMCPSSNIQTGAARNRAEHQLATLVAAGVRVALCTDNPAVSDTRLTREYQIARDLVDAASLDLIRQNALAARF